MLEPHDEEKDTAFVPLWVFFASGYKWLGGFLAGNLGFFCTEMFTADALWISLVAAITTFAGWSTGSFLDINTYINERLPK